MKRPASQSGARPVLLILDRDARRYSQYVQEAGLHEMQILLSQDPDALPPGSETAEIILGPPELLARVIPRLPALCWAQSTWAGVEPLLGPDARRDYLLSGIKGVFGSQMAEYVLCYMLVHRQRVLKRHAAQLRHHWDKITPSPLAGQRVLVLGTGSIGQEIALRCGQFGMRVSGVNRSGGPADHFHQVLPISRMHAALSGTDFMVLALPGTDATRGLVDASVLAGLPSHALLINVGRGTTLHTDAVVRSLEQGTLAGAVLDVFETEPLHADDPLWDTPNLLLTAHVSAVSFVEDIAPVFIANLRRYLSGGSPEHLVDFQRGY